MAALVLACTAGSNASAMNEAALNASMSEMMFKEDFDQENFYKEKNFCSI